MLAAWVVLLATACASQSHLESVEAFDQKSAITFATLGEPMAFVETGIADLLQPEKQPSLVYLGPVELDESGAISFVLWAQLAPGVGGHRIDDIRAKGAVVLKMDSDRVGLVPIQRSTIEQSPYMPTPPVGDTTYYQLDASLLRRMAASHDLSLEVRAGDLQMIQFESRQNSRPALTQFVSDREVPER